MKTIRHRVFSFIMVLTCVSLFPLIGNATEMKSDVGIEFTEVEPTPSSQEPPPGKTVAPPAKTVVKLPQTGEKTTKVSSMMGVVVLGSIYGIWRRRKVENNDET